MFCAIVLKTPVHKAPKMGVLEGFNPLNIDYSAENRCCCHCWNSLAPMPAGFFWHASVPVRISPIQPEKWWWHSWGV